MICLLDWRIEMTLKEMYSHAKAHVDRMCIEWDSCKPFGHYDQDIAREMLKYWRDQRDSLIELKNSGFNAQ